MATIYSTTVAESQGTSFDGQFRSSAGLQHGRIRTASGSISSVSGSLNTANGDKLVIASLRGSDRLVAEISFGDGGEDSANQVFDVGLYAKAEDGSLGAVADANCFDTGAAFGVTAGSAFGDAMGSTAGKQMWEIAGAASEAAGEQEYFLVITTGASAGVFDAADWTIGATVLYTSGD